ncbi:3-hydroxyacyl-CoA dehydrogenase NAD-binding domain-containing protein [Saccharomonospora piscinae]|uniref:3-hydroxyacyl-CoA dehydrogenase NAD-binding domain-containing protein n=1 Tax=Saccharomonospora piscinae TaxID=687388 RepID=UPI0004653C4D|nr:3-hydroxyacyl-CoA dehydrogenase NAD-binding domain-containing protein [Saccharomonospora piscinae]
MSRPFGTVWIIGLGRAGATMTLTLIDHGYHVVGIEADPARLTRARVDIARRARRPDERNLMPASFTTARLARFDCTVAPHTARPADLVIEAVPEDIDLKIEVLRAAASRRTPRTVFATTTAGFPIPRIAADIGQPTRTAGIRLDDAGNPVDVTTLPLTDPVARDCLHDFAHGLRSRARSDSATESETLVTS